MDISIKIIDCGSECIATCVEFDLNCYGKNKEEAMQRIKHVIIFYINSAKDIGINIEPVLKISMDGHAQSISNYNSFQEKYSDYIN